MASAYWEHRAALRQAAYDRANNQTVATVSKAFDRTMNQLDIDIDKIMATYTRKTGLTARDAYQFLRDGVPAGVMDELRARAAAITDKAQAKQIGVMLRTDAYRARISRLDAIKASTRVGLTEAAEAELRAIMPHLRHTADIAYTRTMFDIQKVTAGFQMVGVPSRALDTILKSKWSGMNYAQSVWANRDAMAGMLDRALMEQASMGKLSQITFDNVRGIVDTQAWADKVAAGMKSKFRDEMQYSKYAANRLIRTESAYVANQTTAVAYDECEIEKYEFMATLDNRTSSICSSKDGEIYVTKDKEVGVNWPPLHPHCRSTTAPYIDGLVRENLTRAARDANGKSVYVPRDMKYQEWKAWQDDGAPADVKAWREEKGIGNQKTTTLKKSLSDDDYSEVRKRIDATPAAVRNVYNHYENQIDIRDTHHQNGTYYNSNVEQRGIYFDVDRAKAGENGLKPYESIIHEMAHGIDHAASGYSGYYSYSYNGGEFGKAIIQDANTYYDSIVTKLKQSGRKRVEPKDAGMSAYFEFAGKERGSFVSTSDLMQGASRNRINLGFGHSEEYWADEENLSAEAFAHFFAESSSNPSGYGTLKQYFPEAHKVWLRMIEQMAGGI